MTSYKRLVCIEICEALTFLLQNIYALTLKNSSNREICPEHEKKMPFYENLKEKGTATPMAHIDPISNLRFWRIWGKFYIIRGIK